MYPYQEIYDIESLHTYLVIINSMIENKMQDKGQMPKQYGSKCNKNQYIRLVWDIHTTVLKYKHSIPPYNRW